MARSKYHVNETTLNGIKYDSKAEASRHRDLMLLERAGKIEALHYHGLRFFLGRSDKNRPITYTPDFNYIEDGILVAEEVKGYRVRDFPVRVALFKKMFPEWLLKVIQV